jgi:predicted metalloprotease with PDZ domain
MPEPWKHCFEIEIEIAGVESAELIFVMPVWTPGSYLVREFSRNIHSFSATDEEGGPLEWEKTGKNVWRVRPRKPSTVTVAYQAYAFELSVRTSFLDDSHACINGAGIFMYPEGHEKTPIRLVVEPWPGWKTISTGLDEIDQIPWAYTAPDYDTLIDCPLEIGNHEVFGFKIRDTPHYVAVYGAGNLDAARLCADLQKIVSTAAEIFGGLPYKHYTFIIILSSEGRSGLEHSNSMSLLVNRWAFAPDENYRRFLDLAAHEYFHVWNVKRIHPITLGPFDYNKENYTRMLWMSEGFTDYYSGMITRRAGLSSVEDLLASLSKSIRELQDTPGRLVDSAAEASFDAWIKFYRQDPHWPNITISYYLKGSLIALVLDLEIRNRTDGCSLDDVMRYLYLEYHQRLARGFTDEEFRDACEKVAGGLLERIFDGYCYGTAEIEFDLYLGYAGLRLVPAPDKDKGGPYLGISLKTVDGRLQVVSVTAGSPAYEQGLSLNDEIIGVNGFRMSLDLLAALVGSASPESIFEFLVSRDGRLRTVPVVLGGKKPAERRIERIPEAAPRQRRIYESWLSTTWEDPQEK